MKEDDDMIKPYSKEYDNKWEFKPNFNLMRDVCVPDSESDATEVVKMHSRITNFTTQ